jgi:hypothetical protein
MLQDRKKAKEKRPDALVSADVFFVLTFPVSLRTQTLSGKGRVFTTEKSTHNS